MPGPEEIPDVPAFVVLRVVVGGWWLALSSVVGGLGNSTPRRTCNGSHWRAAELLM
jgi:hypothetical protein